ncbi:E3 ubiquitin-protein ligase parkin isoform X2 [Thalassophryne amazonica]|uniref:E3 ubiquitin-protein ligase parkin isoform X2 n=1 Tax=Thalassophryne amazonica TaxID=390379 RepID=UPI0014714347|nr:E3 ubiquitin-protein ligase parkin isoform X2 [Thalassophryne amazonica]
MAPLVAGSRQMIVFVRYNLGPGVAVELQEEASVADLKEVVGFQHGVRPDHLRVVFAGQELQSAARLQGCDLPEQSTVHVVLPAPGPAPPRLDVGSSHLSSTSAVIKDWSDGEEDMRGDRAALEDRQEVQTGGRSTFFVYCKSCRCIRAGKLRVRCGSCRQTTLTLCSGPSSWDDILLRGRLHGICQSEGCRGNEAEFFTKCASHPTSDDDHSVALNLIRTNIRGVPCIACTDIMDVILVFQCAERHVICLDCFRQYCQTRLNERQFVHHPIIGYSLPCAAGCGDSLIQELHHFRILGEDQYGRYQLYGAEQCLLTIGGVVCPSPGCGAGLLPPNDSRQVECDRRLGCGFVFCRLCRERYHEGACHTLTSPLTNVGSQGFVVGEEASVRGRWDQASLLLIQEVTKRCPQCSVPVERNGGCMHMVCSLCRVEWCWLCAVPWNRDCMANHWFG